ncbi:MAG: hypothetical protein WKF77_13530 [Planctomycetaceae bacterium]
MENILIVSLLSNEPLTVPNLRHSDFAVAVCYRFTSNAERKHTAFLEWCWPQLTVVISPPGDRLPVTRSGNTLSILEKRADAWLIVRDANMLTVAQS